VVKIAIFFLFYPQPYWIWDWDRHVRLAYRPPDINISIMSYDLKHGDVHVICTLEEVLKLVHGQYYYDMRRLFLPYVPLCSGVLASPSVN
jgi:hypothetical protein